MDTTQVCMVRSAKGNDMLCVDNFLYHFVDRGSKFCRWVCNKRKCKERACRSRISTVIVGNDESKHEVVKVTGEHTHDRCTSHEIFKVYERKRRSDLAGEPCTLAKKAQKRKQEYEDDYEEKRSRRFQYEEDEESDEWPADEDNEMFPKTPRKTRQSIFSDDAKRNNRQIFSFDKQKLYMLKTSLGRQMICVEGFLYRLESKSITTTTHRWECIKQGDSPCKVRILTEYLPNGNHRLKNAQDVQHKHEPYTPWKLSKLLEKNNISVNRTMEETDTLSPGLEEAHDFEEVTFTSPSNKPPKKRIVHNINFSAPDIKDKSEGEQGRVKKHRTKAKRVTYTYAEDPLSALSTSIKTDLDKTKFTFLPSAKGNKVLCLDNFIYHLDSRSPRNGRGYWTCLLRRDKIFKCNARVTTEMTNKGPVIVRISGTHFHPDNSADIKRRLCRSIIVENAGKAGLKASQILGDSGNELKEEVKQVVEKSKLDIERRICRAQSKNKYYSEDTVSSFSSVLDSEDDHLNDSDELPTKLEQMCEGSTLKSEKTVVNTNSTNLGPKAEVIFDTTYEDLVEEMIMEDEMEVEYLDTTGYANEDSLIEEVGAEEEAPFDTSIIYQQKMDMYSNITLDPDMNVENVSMLRSAKGGDLLCVDGFIYHLKSTQKNRTYWSCIKCKDSELNCKSRVSTITNGEEIRVFRTTNRHSHPVIEADIKRRLYNEIKSDKNNTNITPEKILSQPLDEITTKYAKMLNKCASMQKQEKTSEDTETITMKLYAVSDGPPSLAVRMTLKALKIPYELISVDYIASEHLTEEYAKMNPQKEIPVLDDDGFFLSESIAIMQYLCDKYAPTNELYPKDPTKRAIVNQRLCFNMGFYYSAISAHSMAPIFFDYKRTDMSLKKVQNALNVFEKYLKTGQTKYVAGDNLTIADFALVSATLCLEAINFDLAPYSSVKKWYETFKQEHPGLWEIANGGMQEIIEFEKNPPDLSHMNHPFHPTRKTKV